jgi:4-carboxymuconolactone decarboxylase
MITKNDDLSPEQRAVFDAIAASRGAVGGPFSILLYRAELAGPAQELGGYLRFRSPMDSAVRETTAMATAHMLRCDFEQMIHRGLAQKAGVEPAVLENIEADRFDALEGDVGLAVSFARNLVLENRVPQELFDRARVRWGDVGLVELTTLIGYYAFLAHILNAFEVLPRRSAQQP